MMYTRSQHRASSPIKDHVDTFTINESLKEQFNTDTFMETGDSTRSLLAPLYSDSFQSDHFKELPTSKTSKNEATTPRHDDTLDDESLMSQSISSIHSYNHVSNASPKSAKSNRSPKSNTSQKTSRSQKSNRQETISPSSSTSSLDETKLSGKDNEDSKENCLDDIDMTNMANITWERWLLKKTIEDIENFNLQRAKRKERSNEKKRLEEEKLKRLEKSSRQREEWLKKKDLEREEKLREEEERIRNEKLKKEEEKRIIEEKSAEKYRQWQEEKQRKEKEERKKKLEEKRKVAEHSRIQKSNSHESYDAWLEKSKNKRMSRTTYGYANGNLMSYYDMGCSPAPSYQNPIPWVDTISIESDKKNSKQASILSPPLLWKGVTERDSSFKKNPKQKRNVVKHSCIDKNT